MRRRAAIVSRNNYLRRTFESTVAAQTILLVDDDPLVRHALAQILADAGVRVLVADSAITAMRVLAQEHVDVLFTDVAMPDQDGIELAKQARQLRPDIRILFATGANARAADRRRYRGSAARAAVVRRRVLLQSSR